MKDFITVRRMAYDQDTDTMRITYFYRNDEDVVNIDTKQWIRKGYDMTPATVLEDKLVRDYLEMLETDRDLSDK